MTNLDKSQNPVKKLKRQGPIRWGALIPFLIIVGLIFVYSFFFLDHHLKKAMEYGATHALGAEVDIDSVKTSFWSASLEIRGIEATNAEHPELNSIQIGRIHWRMLWDALLRGKIAIDDASIDSIALATARKHPGRVLPKPPPPKESSTEKLKQQALDVASKEFDQNIFGDIANLLKGGDPAAQLAGMQSNLKSNQKIKELQADLEQKQKAWKERLDKLPQDKDIQALETKIKSIKTSNFSNVAEAQTSIQTLTSVLTEANSRIGEIKSSADALGKDLNQYQGEIGGLDKMIQDDIKDLESKLKVPKIDAESISRMLFGPNLIAKLEKAKFYMEKARKYIPPEKTKDEIAKEKAEKAALASTPHPRAKGISYVFGKPNAYPLFWLKHAEISSKSSEGGFSGDVKGEILDLSNDQEVTNKASILRVMGDFPASHIFKSKAEITIDHRNEIPVESLNAEIGNYEVAGQDLVNSPDIQFGFAKATGSAVLQAALSGENLDLNINGAFSQIDYKVTAHEPILSEILQSAVKDVPKVTYSANAKGNWTNPKFSVDSNLGRDLSQALAKQLQKKIDETKAKLKKMIDQQIGDQKAKLMTQFKGVQDQVQGVLHSKQAEIDKAKAQIDSEKDQFTKSQSKGLEDQGKKALEGLQKQFHF